MKVSLFLSVSHCQCFPELSSTWRFPSFGNWLVCVSIAGCMIRPGRLVILASSRERYDIYFSNPRPWEWKMHVSSLAKAVRVIIYASVSSPTPRPYWWGVWQVMHDASLFPFPVPSPAPCSCPHRFLRTPNRTLSVCPSFDKHLSGSNLDLKSVHHPQLHSASLRSPPGLFSPYFRLLWLPLNLPLVSLLFMYLRHPFYKDTQLFVICKDLRSKLRVI